MSSHHAIQCKSILVTGAAGFIGWRFAEGAAARGHTVIGVDKKEHFATRTEHLPAAYGEILDRDALESELPRLRGQVHAVVHLGACSSTTATDWEYLQRVNVRYSQMLWNFCRDAGIPFVYASSAATYGEGLQGYADDESSMARLQPLNLYGRSKLEFDLWALAEEKAERTPPAWSGFKFFNVYGFGERHKGKQASVVVGAYDQIQRTGGVKLFRSHRSGVGDGEQKRDFIWVDDVVEALQFAMEKPIRRGIYNLGTGRARTFLDLTRAVFQALDRPEKIEFIDTPLEIRDKYQYFTEARMDRLRSEGFTRSFTPLEVGVARTVARLQKSPAKPH